MLTKYNRTQFYISFNVLTFVYFSFFWGKIHIFHKMKKVKIFEAAKDTTFRDQTVISKI